MTGVLQESAESKKPRGHLDPNSFDRHIEFHTYLPSRELAPFLEHFWTLEWHDLSKPYFSEQVMHRPSVDLFLSADQSGIQGTFHRVRTYTAVGDGKIIGARFLPGAFHLLWPGKMTALQDTNQPLESVFPEVDSKAIIALDDASAITRLSEILAKRLPSGDDNIATVNKIIMVVEEGGTQQTVRDIAKAFNKSERWIQQLFQDYVGIGLKWMLQRHKLLSAAQAIRNIDEPDWSAIAYDLGYSSQQHFITDFRKATSKTPTQYKRDLS